MRLKIIFLLSAFLLSINLTGCGILSKKYSKKETIERKIISEGKAKLDLENINGNIRIFKGNDTGVVRIIAHKEIKVKKKYLDTPFDEITVSIDTTGNVIEIKTEMKKSRGDFIKMDFDRGPFVDYEIWTPGNIDIAVGNVNGMIIADTLINSINISNVNGDVDLGRSSGKIICEITNGNFNAYIDSTKGIDVNIVNGRVTLMLGSKVNAIYDISTMNGSINEEAISFSDLTKGKKELRGRTGSQDENNPVIKIETLNGKINLFGKREE